MAWSTRMARGPNQDLPSISTKLHSSLWEFATNEPAASVVALTIRSFAALRTLATRQHEKRATMVLELEGKVAAVVKKLKERGLVSPYLRSFVVARINPLRWIKGEPPALEDVLKTMRERVAKFDVEKIRPQDLGGAAGPPDDET